MFFVGIVVFWQAMTYIVILTIRHTKHLVNDPLALKPRLTTKQIQISASRYREAMSSFARAMSPGQKGLPLSASICVRLRLIFLSWHLPTGRKIKSALGSLCLCGEICQPSIKPTASSPKLKLFQFHPMRLIHVNKKRRQESPDNIRQQISNTCSPSRYIHLVELVKNPIHRDNESN